MSPRQRLGKHQAWRHVVYAGIYPLESVFQVLCRVFAPDVESFDERPAGESALAAFVVSEEGRPLIGSEVLSSCAWATGRSMSPGPGSPGWLSGFDEVRSEFSARFEDLVAPDPGDKRAEELRRLGHIVGRPIGGADLARCLTVADGLVRVGTALPHGEIRISSQIVAKRRAHSADGHDFLNSFITDDLAMVAEEVNAGKVGTALHEYLRPNGELDTRGRVDVRERLATVLEATAPNDVPLGRWPSKPEHPLALSQQLAVNSALGLVDSGGGIFAVNGPPGTGKTTMLRDLVAAVVVERARRLAELAHPRDAFTGRKERWKTGEYTRVVHVWKPEFTGFEMVLASANNGAVENVTNEIPAADAIDPCWADQAKELDYFPGIATALLAVDRDDEEEPPPDDGNVHGGWALMAARLGNKRNRGKFVNAFWYRKPADPAPDQKPVVEQPEDDPTELGLQAILKDYELQTPPCEWSEAVADFRQALRRATTIQAERARTYDALAQAAKVEQEVRSASQELAATEQRMAAARARLAEASRGLTAWQAEREERVRLRLEHRQFRPGLLEWLTTLGKAMREWRQRDQQLAGAIAAAEQALAAAHAEYARLTREAEVAEQATARWRDALRRAERDLDAIRATLDRARAALGPALPDGDWWQDRPRRELGAPWTDHAWNRARTGLFLAALRLHKAFLQHVPTEMRQSLHAAADVVAGDVPPDLPEEAALAAWRALFFVVPVVSTTFASFARLFPRLGKEALGWLLIDEAGQATPQSAVGALWRSRRAVIVGDPLQLEPITTLPFRAEQAIRGDHGVDEQWLSCRTSVQRLADRLTRLGTWLPGDDGKIWVGAPLAVHRRCDQPMFGIANDIAYDGMMINGTAPGLAEKFGTNYPSLPNSAWIDVTATDSYGHWIPAEGIEVDRILSELDRTGFDMSQVMMIGPFRDVARRLSERAARYDNKLVAGTVHTAQGKQADIVILVLGSDPRRDGARRWAASKPNLLNVAVSRAKRRLYVIGDRQAWANHRHFDVLARRLPRAPGT